MIEESDWPDVYRRLIAEGRERLGPPPTAEEVEALFNGELSEEEAERVRTLLVYYPEIARIMIEPAPAEGEKVLTDDERAADLAALRKRLRPRPHFYPVLAYAAGIVIVAGAALWFYVHAKRPVSPQKERVQVATNAPIDVWPDSVSRGPESAPTATLHATGGPFVLRLLTNVQRHYDAYRLDVVDVGVIWSRPSLTESPGGSFDVTIPGSVLAPGRRYRLVLYGIRGTSAEPVATYTVIVLAK